MSNTFYITTPIYYVNGAPHIGTAYTTTLVDVLARYARLRGEETFFLTGVDEHGQKAQRAAEAEGIASQEYVDRMNLRFRRFWEDLRIDYDDFIRTTEVRHTQVVTHILQTLWDKGDIYQADYEGWYCVSDERFWTEKDLIEGNCPDCGRPVEPLAEANYFFRMSAYQDWLIDYIHSNPNFIRPETRRNEVLGFLRQPLADLCISRPAHRLSWGIRFPFDPDYVTYVWFDALINYISAIGYGVDEARFNRLWAGAIHVIGKDILAPHCVYWPTMLQALGLPLPRTILIHGWWVIEGQKIGKSRGNAVNPLSLIDVYGLDSFRYFLLREMTLGRDANFSEAGLRQRYEDDLANDLGNLLNRLVRMIGRYCEGRVPAPGQMTDIDSALRDEALALIPQVFEQTEALALNETLERLIEFAGRVNAYLEQTAPWRQAKRGNSERVATGLYTAAEALRLASILLHPVLPERTRELWRQLGWQAPALLKDGLCWGVLQPGSQIVSGPPLFPKDRG